MIVLPVPLDRIDAVWPRIVHLIARAVEAAPKDGWTVDGAERAIRQGSVAAWVAVDWVGVGVTAAGVCLAELTPDGRAARIVMATGRCRASWIAGIGQIEEWARAWKCERLEIPGRRGWSRVLASHGYRLEAGQLMKRL